MLASGCNFEGKSLALANVRDSEVSSPKQVSFDGFQSQESSSCFHTGSVCSRMQFYNILCEFGTVLELFSRTMSGFHNMAPTGSDVARASVKSVLQSGINILLD